MFEVSYWKTKHRKHTTFHAVVSLICQHVSFYMHTYAFNFVNTRISKFLVRRFLRPAVNHPQSKKIRSTYCLGGVSSNQILSQFSQQRVWRISLAPKRQGIIVFWHLLKFWHIVLKLALNRRLPRNYGCTGVTVCGYLRCLHFVSKEST